ncbi:hypothetical protein MRY87_10720 [bacterium]|nr:hypothetical protein [bacterium]
MKRFSAPLHLSFLLILLGGCSSTHPVEVEKKVYRVADRQLPPDLTYSRLRWVHLPETHPSRDLRSAGLADPSRPKLLPVVHFSLEDQPLCTAATVLAGLNRYSTYCSSLLREETITINTLGTFEELAREIEATAGVKVTIDHENREVRFLAGQPKEAAFFNESSSEDTASAEEETE